MNGIVYYVYHKSSGKGYVGKHCRPNLYARFNAHCKSKNLLGLAIRKHGEENFKVIQLDTVVSDEELWDKEIFYIDLLNTLHPNGYNLTIGGEGSSGLNFSEATKEAYSFAKKGVKWGPQTDRQKQAAADANRVMSKDQVQYIRKSTKTTWELAIELKSSYQTIKRIKDYKVFKLEP